MSGVVGEEEYSDDTHLLRSTNDHDEGVVVVLDIEQQQPHSSSSSSSSSKPRHHSFKRLLDRTINSTSSSFKDRDRDRDRDKDPVAVVADPSDDAVLTDAGAPLEWVLLLLGCLLGLATGLFVVTFNMVSTSSTNGPGRTPSEGAAWLRLQRIVDTWHQILLIPVTSSVIVGMMYGLLEILDQIRHSNSSTNSKSQSHSQRQGFDFVAAVFPTIKAIQAAVTLGTGCSLGPEGPSVDIGTSCAKGFSVTMDNSSDRELLFLLCTVLIPILFLYKKNQT